MNENYEIKKMIEATLRSLGITANYRGYRQLCIAIAMVAEKEDRLLNAKKEIYIPISEVIHCNPETIERNIRTVINRMWKVNREGYHALVGFETFRSPETLEFIDAIAYHVRYQLFVKTP